MREYRRGEMPSRPNILANKKALPEQNLVAKAFYYLAERGSTVSSLASMDDPWRVNGKYNPDLTLGIPRGR